MRIEVTQEDIDKGTPRNCADCPVAIAASRALGERVEVGRTFMSTANRSYWIPREVRNFITSFDSRDTVQPFSFEL